MGQINSVTVYRVEWKSQAVRGTENMPALRPLVVISRHAYDDILQQDIITPSSE